MERSRILVIVVTYNAMAWVDRCMGCLINTTIPCDVLVVDNGSTDGTQNYIKEHYPNFIFKQCEKNLGFGKANNIGLQKVLDEGYEFAYLLNQDAWVMPDTFERLIEISERNPDYGVLSPMQIQANKEHLDCYFVKNVIGYSQQSEPLLIDDLFFGRKNEVYDVTYVMAAHWMITRNCLETVGGFSPTFPHYGEDDNYMGRVIYHNLKVGIVPYLSVVHDRAGREETKEKLIYMGYIRSLIYLSRLDRSLWKSLFIMFDINLELVFKYKSWKPVSNLFKIIFQLRSIKWNKKSSMVVGRTFLR